ncbi:hypothetical protein BV898_02866 [Hypsibius exemplaris]|uniref:Myb-like domain-containing protein n=1 Tax=Hypsibius exemplaris TaxID=2072580 RepID=A0A1W0X6V2_HYPEX|nr:hypothetical protein BV898_02866 [Hypsibius exemplaris]
MDWQDEPLLGRLGREWRKKDLVAKVAELNCPHPGVYVKSTKETWFSCLRNFVALTRNGAVAEAAGAAAASPVDASVEEAGSQLAGRLPGLGRPLLKPKPIGWRERLAAGFDEKGICSLCKDPKTIERQMRACMDLKTQIQHFPQQTQQLSAGDGEQSEARIARSPRGPSKQFLSGYLLEMDLISHSPPVMEYDIDQRSSTPKSGRVVQNSPFQSDQSAIMEVDRSSSCGRNRPNLKRRLFAMDSDPHSSKFRTPQSPRVIDQTSGNHHVDYTKREGLVTLPSYFDVPEDPENQNWTVHQRNAFFEAVNKCGSDYSDIAQQMKEILGAKLGSRARSRSVRDVRKYYLRIVEVVSRIMGLEGSKDEGFMRYAVVNFGEWTRLNPGKKLPVLIVGSKDEQAVRDDRMLIKQLILRGEAVPVLQGAAATPNRILRTPNALSLRRLHNSEGLTELPPAIVVRLHPRTASTLANVKRSGRSSVLSVTLSVTSTVKHLYDLLRSHWHFERTEKKYLSSEAPELTLRPPAGFNPRWPHVMPDFHVLLHHHQLCWSAYQRFMKRFPHANKPNIKQEDLLCPDSVATHRHGPPIDEDAVFYSNIDSDGEEDGEAEDVTLIPQSGNAASAAKSTVLCPRTLYPEFVDEKGEVSWSNRRHPGVPLPELYLIAGSAGELLLDYDWILADDDPLDFSLSHFQPEDITLDFWQILQLTPPAAFRTITKPTVNIPAALSEQSQKNPTLRDCNDQQRSPTKLFVNADSASLPVLSSSAVDDELRVLRPPGSVGLLATDSGVGTLSNGGDILSEFIIMQPTTASIAPPSVFFVNGQLIHQNGQVLMVAELLCTRVLSISSVILSGFSTECDVPASGAANQYPGGGKVGPGGGKAGLEYADSSQEANGSTTQFRNASPSAEQVVSFIVAEKRCRLQPPLNRRSICRFTVISPRLVSLKACRILHAV